MKISLKKFLAILMALTLLCTVCFTALAEDGVGDSAGGSAGDSAGDSAGETAAASVIIPEGATEISEKAFYGDASITEIELPEGLQRIESLAFAYTSLSSVLLPASLEFFAFDAFEGCSDNFFVRVYPESKALELCESYQIPYRIVSAAGRKVGISMPTRSLQRWYADGAYIESILTEQGYETELNYAANDVNTQVTQIENMINDGCQVLIIAPISASSLSAVLAEAKQKGVTVISYDRLIGDTDADLYYTTFDNYMVGTIQANYIVSALNLNHAEGPFNIEFTAGDSGDVNAGYYFAGAMAVLQSYIDSGKLNVVSGQTAFEDAATSGWRAATAENRAANILSSFYADGTSVDAWLCSNDSTAYGVIHALENGYAGNWPVITGQDCDLSNVKYIIAGKQAMSVFKDTRIVASQAANMAIQILENESVDINDTSSYSIPAYLCSPVYVDANNYWEILVEGGYYSAEQLQ